MGTSKTTKVQLSWVRFELAPVAVEGIEPGATVKLSGTECRVGDWLLRSPGGLSVLTPEEVEGIPWLPVAPEDVPELEIDDDSED